DANEACLRIAAGFVVQMLTAAEANLQTHGINLCVKERAQILRCRIFDIDLQARQKILEQVLLVAPQRLAVATAEEISGTAQRLRFFSHTLSVSIISGALSIYFDAHLVRKPFHTFRDVLQ